MSKQSDATREDAGDEPSVEHGDLEMIAAIRAGSLSLDHVDDATLERWQRHLGARAVSDLLAQTDAAPSRRHATERVLRFWPWALAASALIAAGVVWYATRPSPITLRWSQSVAAWTRRGVPPEPGPWSLATGDVVDYTWARSDSRGSAETDPVRVAMWRGTCALVAAETSDRQVVLDLGALIGDRWLLSYYHPLETIIQRAALLGEPGRVGVLLPDEGNERSRFASIVRPASVWRAAPESDLALIRLDENVSSASVSVLRLAERVSPGEPCRLLFSFAQDDLPGHSQLEIRNGDLESASLIFPDDLAIHGVKIPPGPSVVRVPVAMTIVSGGPSPVGPVLNAKSELIGLGFEPPQSLEGLGSRRLHLALDTIRAFTSNLPTEPELVPFDVRTAGLGATLVHEPEALDLDQDGKLDAVVTACTSPSGDAGPSAVVIYIDSESQTPAPGKDVVSALLPHGLWGTATTGGFGFDLVLVVRSDGVRAFGRKVSHDAIDEIRVDRNGDSRADVIWRRDDRGRWRVAAGAGEDELVPGALEDRQKVALRRVSGVIFGS